MSGGAAAGAAAAQAAMINAIRSFGVVVTVEPDEFVGIIERQENPLVVTSTGGIFRTEYRYLVSYKGLTFFTKSRERLELHDGVEIVKSGNILLPG